MKRKVSLLFIYTLISTFIYSQDAGTIGAMQTLCYGDDPDPIVFTDPPNLAGGSLSYYMWQVMTSTGGWEYVSGAPSGPSASTFQPPSDYGFKVYRAEVGIGSSSGLNIYYTNSISINIQPVISDRGTMTPESSSPICYDSEGPEISFSSLPTASPTGTIEFSYTWTKQEEGSTTTTLIAQNELTSLETGNLTTTTTFKCSVFSKQSYGVCNVGPVEDVTVIVHPEFSPGVILDDQAICPGTTPDDLTFSVEANAVGTDLTWQQSVNNSSWSDISSAKSTSYNPGSLTSQKYFRCKVNTDCSTLYTNSVLISLLEDLTPGTISEDQTICYNSAPDPIIFSVDPSPASISFTYTWYSKEEGSSSWSLINGATTSTLSPGNLAITTSYRCEVGNPLGSCGEVRTNEITISVIPEFNAGVIGEEQTICMGTTPKDISFTSSYSLTGNFTLTWQEKISGSSWLNKTNNSPESFNPGILNSTKQYRCELSTICGSIYTNTVSVIIAKDVTSGSIGEDQTICYNSLPEIISDISSPSDGVPPYTYEWLHSFDTLTWTSIANNENEYQPENLTDTSFFKRVVHDACGSDTSNSVLIRVKDKIPDPLTTLEDVYCRDDSVNLTLLNAENSNQWFDSNKQEIGVDTFYIVDPLTEDMQLYVIIKDEEGCSSDTLSQVLTIDPISADFTVHPSTVAPNSPVQFTPLYENASSYFWTLDEDVTSTEPAPQYIYHDLGSFDISLSVTSQNNCVASKSKENAVTVSNQVAINYNSREKIKLYPIPAKDLLTIETTGDFNTTKLVILSVTGNILIERQLKTKHNTIDISSLISGMYIVKITDGNNCLVSDKIIKR